MADEAAVENLPVNRFFCHKCSQEVPAVLPDFTCPNCQCGFIEELEAQPEQIDDIDNEMEVVQPFEMLSEMLMGMSGPEERRGSRGRRSERRARNFTRPIENLIQEFMVNLSGGWAGVGAGTIGVGTARGATGPVFLLGNPGDYAWGREGLDAIVTQLLNQMDTAGPPPLAKDKINEIPVVIITKDQVDINLQCSVCWEDFKVEEPVRKLPCEHVYHENCIIPWLELHGTCPICRKTLTDESNSENQDNSNNVVGNGLAALFRVTNDSTNSRTSSTSSSGTTSTSTSSSSSSRPDFNMDIEYD